MQHGHMCTRDSVQCIHLLRYVQTTSESRTITQRVEGQPQGSYTRSKPPATGSESERAARVGPTAPGISLVTVGNVVYTLVGLHHSGRAGQGVSRANQGNCRVSITTTLYAFRQVMASFACSQTTGESRVGVNVASATLACVNR